MAKPNCEFNPVVEVYRGIEIRKYPQIKFRVDVITFKEIIDAHLDTGMSTRSILGHSSKPCESCKNVFVTTFNSKDDEVKIKRGILSKRIPKNL